jgi:hypothetical protein
MDKDKALRDHLIKLLSSRQAHVDLDTAFADLPRELQGRKSEALSFTPWQLLEHMRIAQWDILEFSRDPKHVSPEFPAGYWPVTEAPLEAGSWDASVARFRSDLEAMSDLVSDPTTDLFATIPHGTGQTILREALLIADHNAYHLGQLVLVRRGLDCWG